MATAGTIDEICDHLKQKAILTDGDTFPKTVCLIGAGASVSAGIPLAGKIVEMLKSRYSVCRNHPSQDYAEMMGLLSRTDRRRFLQSIMKETVDENGKVTPSINSAHLYLSLLIKKGYIDRVLTTNFDTLLAKSLSYFNIFPGIYDFASSQNFIPGEAADISVFHLHGQKDGFVLLNTKDEVNSHREHVKQVINHSLQGRSIIVVGYSGENDPVFDHLAELVTSDKYQDTLYWVGYKDARPSKFLKEKILDKYEFAKYVNGYDADSFFLNLCRSLELGSPDIISKPFSYLTEIVNNIADFDIDDTSTSPTHETSKWIGLSKQVFEDRESVELISDHATELKEENITKEIREAWLNRDFEKAADFEGYLGQNQLNAEAQEFLSNLYNDWGVEHSGNNNHPKAIEKFKKAASINKESALAEYNIGTEYGVLATMEEDLDTKRQHYETAFAHYDKSLKISPDYQLTLFNYANDKAASAVFLTNTKEQKKLWSDAFKMYEKTTNLNPEHYEAYENWGNYLSRLAEIMKTPAERKELLKEAIQKTEIANNLNPGFGTYNLACYYALLGETETALAWLEESVDSDFRQPKDFVMQDPDLKSLHDNPRFKRLMNEGYSNASKK